MKFCSSHIVNLYQSDWYYGGGYVFLIKSLLYFLTEENKIVRVDLSEVLEGKALEVKVLKTNVNFFGMAEEALVWMEQRELQKDQLDSKYTVEGADPITCLATTKNWTIVACSNQDQHQNKLILLDKDLKESSSVCFMTKGKYGRRR